MTDIRVEDLGSGLYAIDAFMEETPGRLACYLFDTPQRTLVEVGPSATLHHLSAALDELGIDDLANIVVTHVHIDHAGGAGHLAARFPDARIGVHSAGARHLADPERLWRSAARIYGEHELTEMWGTMEPVSPERMLILDEGDEIQLGAGRKLDVLYTPGHAKHHVAFHDEATGGIFVGDTVGVCYPHGHIVLPLTPPPDFDPDETDRQIERMLERAPRFVGFAHFGPNYDVADALESSRDRLWNWVDFVSSIGALDDDQAAQRLRDQVLSEMAANGQAAEDVAFYDRVTHWPMQVTGIRRWLQQSAR